MIQKYLRSAATVLTSACLVLGSMGDAFAAKQPSIRARRQQRAGVPTPTDRAVGGPESQSWPKRFQHLRQHDRFVDITWHCA